MKYLLDTHVAKWALDFDRILISTAIAEGMTIITADESIQKYDVPWIW